MNISDPIYGTMDLLPCQIELFNTIAFQRLTRLKQLGVCYTVFPGATHTRAEHSLGVAWLARKLLRQLQLNQPEISIQKEDECLIALAAQAHDLGHGIASHAFESWLRARAFEGRLNEPEQSANAQKYLVNERKGPLLRSAAKKIAERSARELSSKIWSHEEQSIRILKHIMEQLPAIKHIANAFEIMAALIRGDDRNCSIATEKKWMLEIVNNACCGIDVDRLDYLQRDAHHVFGSSGDGGLMNVDRIIASARITADRQHLAFDVQILDTLYQIFHRRWSMFRSVYLHNQVVGNELALRSMLDAMYDSPTMSVFSFDIFTNVDQYLLLDDTCFAAASIILQQSKSNDDQHLQRLVSEWSDFQKGKSKFVCVAQVNLSSDQFNQVGDVTAEQITSKLVEQQIEASDLHLHCCKFHFGASSDDPLSRVWFYDSCKDYRASFRLDSLHRNAAPRLRLTPSDWQEWQIRIYSQKETVQKAADAIQRALEARVN